MKIALVENFGLDFYSSRLRYALFLKSKGYDVVAVVPDDEYVALIMNAGVPVRPIELDIRKRTIRNVFLYVVKLYRIFREENFDVIHLYRLQPNLFGTPTAFFSSKRVRIVNHITGLGMAFTKKDLKYSLLQFVIKLAYCINKKIFHARLVFQNTEDEQEIGCGGHSYVVRGSAVDEEKFHPGVVIGHDLTNDLLGKYKVPNGINLLFVSRLLKQKGLRHLVDAINSYNSINEEKINLIVAGWLDPSNPDSFSEQEINSFDQQDHLFFLGKRSDVDQLIAFSDIAILPTFYREGTPRFLLEAMAMAKPIVTTDMPGCNHLIDDNKNGVLVKPQSIESLVSAFQFMSDKDLVKMGNRSFQIYRKMFSEELVYNRLVEIYSN